MGRDAPTEWPRLAGQAPDHTDRTPLHLAHAPPLVSAHHYSYGDESPDRSRAPANVPARHEAAAGPCTSAGWVPTLPAPVLHIHVGHVPFPAFRVKRFPRKILTQLRQPSFGQFRDVSKKS